MRISDWSSDVCSSDLLIERAGLPSSPRWLRQVHGTAVVRFGAALSETHPHPGPPLEGEGARAGAGAEPEADAARSEEHTSELQSLMRISYAVLCLKKKNKSNIPNYKVRHTQTINAYSMQHINSLEPTITCLSQQ